MLTSRGILRKNFSVIFGYDMYTEKKLAGEDTFTTRLDINFP